MGQRLELIGAVVAFLVPLTLLVPVEWAEGVTFALGSATDEGIFASLAGLVTGGVCLAALLRRYQLSPEALLALAVLTALATLQLADLLTDAGGTCPRDPDGYWEPDLAEEFEESGSCYISPSINLLPLAWGSMLASSALTAAGACWRMAWRRWAVVVFVVTALLLWVISALAGLQHLE